MRVEDYNIKSYIKNDKKILIWDVGSNIDDIAFTGLGFRYLEENKNNLFYFDKGYQLEKYQNSSFDYFFIHGFETRGFDVNLFKRWNIKIDKVTLDFLGEGFDLNESIKDFNLIEKWEKICNHLIISTGFEVSQKIKQKYPNVRFFEHDLSGPRMFCSKYTKNMVHGEYFLIDNENYISRRWLNDDFLENHNHSNVGELVMGLRWSDNHKSKLFQWTPGTPRHFRILLQKQLENYNLLDYGHVSFKRDNYDNIRIGYGDKLEREVQIITKHCEITEILFDTKFALHKSIAKDAYIGLVSESSHYKDINFITEKCVKPFYNLQFPIIQGPRGIVSHLRKMDFDMFDDIIDHSYDEIDVKDTLAFAHEDTLHKSDKIVNEINKLKDLDIHKLYLKNKERFIYNQENLYNKTIKENDLFEKMAEFIFGDDLKLIEVSESFFRKIWV